MRLYRAIADAERVDIAGAGVLRPGPPSFMGKWFATTTADAARWGQAFFRASGDPFFVLEVEVPDDRVGELYPVPFLDRIGPAYFADADQLGIITIIGVCLDIPVGGQ
jgi:hypothetical protein